MTEMDQVYVFHHNFLLPLGGDNLLFSDPEALQFRTKFLEEELAEFKEACEAGDKVKALDALIDLTYVAMGTALFMGVFPGQWNEAFSAVHNANMSKMRVPSAKASKRGSSFDVVKPPGFIPPEHKIRQILGE
jgi:predicted HAD superfamily Cof-like phosphohydrolase